MRMEGRKVIVTGGAQGIGRGIATRLAQEGASVMIGDLNSDGAEAAAAELRRPGSTSRLTRSTSAAGTRPRS